MPIPDFQTLMLPLLHLLGDGNPHDHADTIEALSRRFELTDAEVAELLPSGKQGRFDNRVRWAKVYLQKASLVENRGRGEFVITQRGRDVLASNPTKIDMKMLEAYPEYRAFRSIEGETSPVPATTKPSTGGITASAPAPDLREALFVGRGSVHLAPPFSLPRWRPGSEFFSSCASAAFRAIRVS